jgi:hypothetical protein
MRLDDVRLQTTLNTPNISGIWQIRKCSLVSLKAHQPRQGQSPLAGLFFFIFVCLFETSAVVYRRNKGTSHRKCSRNHSPETGQIPEKT